VKNFNASLITLFKTTPGGSNLAFYNDVGGRLYQDKAPPGTTVTNGAYAIFQILNDVDLDTFTENMVNVFLQFSLYSGDDSSEEVLDIDSDLSIMLKDKVWPMTGATIVYSHRTQGDGPHNVPANVEAGTEEYWLKMVDYEILFNRD